jgi:hypothetical protein
MAGDVGVTGLVGMPGDRGFDVTVLGGKFHFGSLSTLGFLNFFTQ